MRLRVIPLLVGTGLVAQLGGCLNPAAVRPPASAGSLQAAASEWEQAIEARDADRIAALLAPDAVAMYPRPYPIIGREASRQAWAELYQNPDIDHPISVDRVEVAQSGDLGYIYGRWWGRNAREGSNLGGRYLTVWKLIGGEWQIVMHSANLHDDMTADRTSR